LEEEVEEVPKQDDEVEKKKKARNKRSSCTPYTTYDDTFELRGTIENLSNLVINLRDTSYNLSS
jgi:hypothetical protein